MSTINVGIIGCGRIADLHYPGYKNNRDARIYAISDCDDPTTARRKKEWKAEKAYADYRDLLADPKVDAVEILTPQLLHEEMVLEAARAGKHIAIQKPMTIDLPGADRMIEASVKSGKILRVTDNYLFYPPIVLAKKMIDSGEIGDPNNMRIKFISGGSGGWAVPDSSWAWRLKESMEGRPMQTFDHGHHLWSVASFLQGKVERVTSWIDSSDGVIDSPAVIMWKCEGGARYGTCDYANASGLHIPSKYYGNDEWFEITGTRGIIMVHRCTGNVLGGPPVSFFNGKRWKHFAGVKSDYSEGFIGATKNFIAAIKGEEAPLLSGEGGREILRLDLAIQRSATRRREVYVDEMDSAFPAFYSYRRRMAEVRANPYRKKRFTFFSGGDYPGYAKRAVELTEGLMARFDERRAEGWSAVIGLRLLADGGSPEELFGLEIDNGKARLTRGTIPRDAILVVKVPAGVWAAILMGKKRIEMALIQGKLKLEGRAEEGLKLRNVFKL
ncbi:MAG TPA: Gfo/Idh/MocA family oxidoreductase [Spirochaetota bacterium]|nr:Gfo/Idh/MocA family oxidoreductase [Spirochaetota bacterium]